jgi:hypothetical protein
MRLLTGILLITLGQILSFIQLQGYLKYDYLKNNLWIPILLGIPTSAIFIYGIKILTKYYNGELWPSRIIGFSIGTIVFGILSYYLFNEQVNLKTSICLILSFLIILVQLLWK